MDDAIFRPESSFEPANLSNCLPFWEDEILKDHPHKQKILGWLKKVKIEEFLNSFTTAPFKGRVLIHTTLRKGILRTMSLRSSLVS